MVSLPAMPSSLSCWQCGSQFHFSRDCPHWLDADAELDAKVASLDVELATHVAELATLDAMFAAEMATIIAEADVELALLDAEEATLGGTVVSGGPGPERG